MALGPENPTPGAIAVASNCQMIKPVNNQRNNGTCFMADGSVITRASADNKANAVAILDNAGEKWMPVKARAPPIASKARNVCARVKS